ncbi:MAG: S8 family serine peptidase [Myxococcota bacterium]
MRGSRPSSSIRARATVAAMGLLSGPLVLVLVAVARVASPAPSISTSPSPSPGAVATIDALLAEKAGRTPVQRKLASRLIHAERMHRRVPIAAGLRSLAIGLDRDATGRVLVDLKGEIGPALAARIEALGGHVVSRHPPLRALRAWMPLGALETLAAEPAVERIRPADRAYTHALNVSEGDGAHRANLARSTYGIDGSGLTVGVLSDGADALPSLVASGDLPAGVTVLPGQAGAGNEGAAMLEIVHDLAPGASLLFATAFGGQAAFASNILALRAAGADVIVDDVAYFGEAVFQDDSVAAAVDAVRADGALYFSSAGNGGSLDKGTAGVWEGNYVPGTRVNGLPAHSYGAGDITNTILADSPFAYSLHWSDPIGASNNDYDLFLTDAGFTTILGASTDVQNGSGDPLEIIDSIGDDTGRLLVVVKHNGSANRFLHLNSNRGRLEHATVGQTAGHSAARGAISVAAVFGRNKTGGFTGSESVATYSSDGPRRVFFEANGAAITPGNFSATGGELRAKPDLAAADCVTTAAPGFAFFCGTSAAAPHAAAIAALMLDRAGGPGIADPSAIRAALTGSTFDIEAPGVDRDAGSGLANALAAGTLVPAYCTSPADCSDGVFCNGAEICQAGTCAPGTPPACNGPTPFCDETADACVACLAAGDCSDGLACNGVESCALGACVAGTPLACSGSTPFCDEASDACVACLSAASCDDGLFCNGAEGCVAGSCVAGSAPVCSAPTAVCSDAAASCVGCLGDLDCGGGVCVESVCLSTPPPAVPAFGAAGRLVLLGWLALVAGSAVSETRRRLGSRRGHAPSHEPGSLRDERSPCDARSRRDRG